MVKVLRWIAVLPAAIAAAAIGYVLAMLFNMLMEYVYSLVVTSNSWWLQILRYVISDTIFGATFVWVCLEYRRPYIRQIYKQEQGLKDF